MSSLIDTSTKNIIREYVNKGYVTGLHFSKLVFSETNIEFQAALKTLITIDDDMQDELWRCVKERWNLNDIDTVFNQYEIIFFEALVRNKGILTRRDILRVKLKNVFTPVTLNKITKQLSDKGYIDIYRLKGWEVFYSVNLSLFNEVYDE